MSRSPNRPRRQRERGFTLLELLVTLVVTTIGLVGLLSLHVSLNRKNEQTGRADEAVVIANQTIEQLRSLSPTEMMSSLTGSPTSVPPVDVTTSTVAGRNGLTYSRAVAVTSVTNGLWLVRVVVTWTDDGATPGADGGLYDHAMSMELLRTNKELL
jgi:prepilin-type N-terminal cleavage/methylation domain-containing protein